MVNIVLSIFCLITENNISENEVADLVNKMFPEDYYYKVIKCENLVINSSGVKYNIELRVNVNDKAGVNTFLQKFYETSGCTFNIQAGRQDKSSEAESARSKLRGFRKCSMNVCEKQGKENKQPGKNTNCLASINFRVENSNTKQNRMDKQEFPLWLNISYDHNHSQHRADFLKFKSVSQATKDEYTDMFMSGFSPSGAHAEMKRRIRARCPDDWHVMYGDRSVLPSVFWVFYWNRRYTDTYVGSRDGIDCYVKASEVIEEYNSKCMKDFPLPDGESYAKITQTEDGQTVAVICNPFMRRVHHTIPQSADIVFVDATSNIDRNDTKLFHLMCPSIVGGLPLADILCTREDTQTVHFAFELLKTVLTAGSFYGRGSDVGPTLFMTDDSDSLRNSLSLSWPSAELLLCVFHCLQALWVWLWDGKHNTVHPDRPVLLKLFRQVLYSENEAELSNNLEEMYASPVCHKYPNFQAHLMSHILPRIDAWCLEHRVTNKLPTSNNNTNNLVECSFRHTKEEQMNRHKAYNLCDLLSLLLDNSEFYQNKCVDCANNVLESWLRNCHSKYVVNRQPDIDTDKIEQVGPNSYLVPSETHPDISYLVDMNVRNCSCPVGRLRGPCKHKNILAASKNLSSFDVLPTTNPIMRQLFMKLGTGKVLPLDYFLPMLAPPVTDCGDMASIPEPGTSTHSSGQPSIPDQHNSSAVEVDTAAISNQLGSALRALQDKLTARLAHDPEGYKRAVADLEKTVEKLPKTSDSALQKCLHSFGKLVTQVLLF